MPANVYSLMGPEELGRLVDEQAGALVLYARQWCAAPEDVVQEAFLKLVKLRKRPEHVIPWLYRVVRNRAIDMSRSARRRQEHETAARVPEWFTSESSDLDLESATAALQSIPIEQREIIVAHLWGGLTFEQIADLADISSSTAHRWYQEGLVLLRERLSVPCPKPTTPN